MLLHEGCRAEREDGCRRDHDGEVAGLGRGAFAFDDGDRRHDGLALADRADHDAARVRVDGNGRLSGFVGEDAGLRAVQRDLRACDGNGDGIPVFVKARAGERQLRGAGRDEAGLEAGVHVAPSGQVGVDERVDEIAVGDRVGEGPRGATVDIVAVAAAVFRAPELVHRDAVFARGRFISGSRAAVVEFVMRDDHGVVDGDGAVFVRVVNDDLFLRDGELAVFIGNGDVHAGVFPGMDRGRGTDDEDDGGEDGEDLFHGSVLLSLRLR